MRYPTANPLEQTLSSYSLDLSGNPALSDLLLQARGEQVTIGGAQSVAGTIVSVERVEVPDAPARHMLLLATDQGLQRISLDEVTGIKFESEELRAEMEAALLAVAQSRASDEMDVRLQFDGEGERFVQVGYVREMPVWKTSYRLVVGEDGMADLQGWAIMDNPTPLDLDNVQVTFVAGQPVSFITSLYEAVYVPRQRIATAVSQSGTPPVYEADLAMPVPAMAPAARMFEEAALESLQDAGVEAMATGRQSGVTFQYVVDEPVSIGRFESAMIPIVQQRVPAQQLSIFDPNQPGNHPLRGLRLHNDTGMHLAAGTVTVFDEGTFTGTARLADLLPGDDALLAFATDLAVTVTTEASPEPDEVLSLRIMDGALVSEVRRRFETTYSFLASGADSRLVLVNHPRNHGYDLISPLEPAPLTTAGNYRFGVALAADSEFGDAADNSTVPVQLDCVQDGACELVVREEQLTSRQVAIGNMSPDDITLVLSNDLLDEASALLLRNLQNLGEQIGETQAGIDSLDFDRGTIFEEQERIRANMAELDQSSSLYQRYLSQLTDQEDRLEEIAAERAELAAQLEELQSERADLLRNL